MITNSIAARIQENNLAAIPEALTSLPQWVVWQSEPRETGKPAKAPYSPMTRKRASVSDPSTWGTFDQAVSILQQYNVDGLGFVFTESDPFVGIDLDACRNPETGTLDPWAKALVEQLASYTEISPSGTGLHILIKGQLPEGTSGLRTGKLEVYSAARFFGLTGNRLDAFPAEPQDRQATLGQLLRDSFQPSREPEPFSSLSSQGGAEEEDTPQGVEAPSPGFPPADQDLLNRLFQAANGEKVATLWAGNWKTLGYPSQSEADQALVNILVFYTQDPVQIDRLFRLSSLYRGKWDKPDYRDRTIANALKRVTPRQTAQTPSGSYTAADLQYRIFPKPKLIVGGLVTPGLNLLAGRPKMGKSWLALDMSLAVALGGLAFGTLPVEVGDVLYLALEDNPRRMQQRIQRLLPTGSQWPTRLHIHHTFPKLGAGFEEQITNWLQTYPTAKLVVIDTFAKVKARRPKGVDPYADDVEQMDRLQKLIAGYLDVGFLTLGHTRKMDAEDPVEQVSGTFGLTGSADTILVLSRTRGQATAKLFVTGRDIEERELAIQFDSGIWTVLGDAEEYARSAERQRLISLVKDAGGVISLKELLQVIGKKEGAGKMLVKRAVDDGDLLSPYRGWYSLPGEPPQEELQQWFDFSSGKFKPGTPLSFKLRFIPTNIPETYN